MIFPCRSRFRSAPALLYGFILSGGFSALAWEHIRGQIFHLYALPRIGSIVFVIRLCGNFNIPDKAVIDRDPLGVMLAAALFFIDVDMVDQLSEASARSKSAFP